MRDEQVEFDSLIFLFSIYNNETRLNILIAELIVKQKRDQGNVEFLLKKD
jgi:hypothetical protein